MRSNSENDFFDHLKHGITSFPKKRKMSKERKYIQTQSVTSTIVAISLVFEFCLDHISFWLGSHIVRYLVLKVVRQTRSSSDMYLNLASSFPTQLNLPVSIVAWKLKPHVLNLLTLFVIVLFNWKISEPRSGYPSILWSWGEPGPFLNQGVATKQCDGS